MTTVRIFAFAAAVLLTALLCGVIAQGLSDPAPIHRAADAAAATPRLPKSSADF
jgi:hypothetical protein